MKSPLGLLTILFLLTSCATSYETKQSMRTLKEQDETQSEQDKYRKNGAQGNREQGDYDRLRFKSAP